MRIRQLADRLGTTPQTIRYYESRGLVPPPAREENRYRSYGREHEEQLRLLLGLRQLGLPVNRAADLASLCVAGKCESVSSELRGLIGQQREEIRRRRKALAHLDQRLVDLDSHLAAGDAPRKLITLGKEDTDGDL